MGELQWTEYLKLVFLKILNSAPVADLGGFHWFPRKPSFKIGVNKLLKFMHYLIMVIIINLFTVAQPFLTK